MKKQIHVYYSGRVQGVGFRYTAQNLARELGIYGWVKNLDDGRVEICLEAEEEKLRQFLTRTSEYFKKYIRDTDIEYSAATGEFKNFEIKF